MQVGQAELSVMRGARWEPGGKQRAWARLACRDVAAEVGRDRMEGKEAAQSGPASDGRWCHWARGQHLVLPPVLQGCLTSRQERRPARPLAGRRPAGVWGGLSTP